MDNSADVNYLQVLTARQSLLSARLTAVQDQYDEAPSVRIGRLSLGGGCAIIPKPLHAPLLPSLSSMMKATSSPTPPISNTHAPNTRDGNP